MQTGKLISTISYNTAEFLQGKLHNLVRQGIIEYAHWVHHRPEEDEKKAHAHVVLKPNKRLDTSALRNEFVEPVAGEEKPRGVLPFQSSKMNDWLLYAVHDVAYLLRKNQNRKERYQRSDLLTTDADLLDEDWRAAHEGEDTRIKQVIELAEHGVTWPELLKMGIIPMNGMFPLKEVFLNFYTDKTDRNGREGHEHRI